MKAALCTNLEAVSVTEIPVPKIGPGEILLKVSTCGLCGSDIKKLLGKGLASPKVLGHEVVGTVEALGEGTDGFKIGQRVVAAHHVPCLNCHYCRHGNYSMCQTFKESNLDPGGFAEFLRIPAPHVRFATFALPDDLPNEKALFTEPLACALRCLRRVTLHPGDTVLIVGFGSVGLLLHSLLQRIPANVIVCDLDEQRLKHAKKLGALAVHPVRSEVKEVVADATKGRGADLVLFTAGARDMFGLAFSWVRDGGTLCLFAELSGSGSSEVKSTEIYQREITITSSYSPGPEDLASAFRLIAAKEVNLDAQKVVSFSLDEILKAVQMTLERKILKAAIQP